MRKVLVLSLFLCLQWLCFYLIIMHERQTHDEQLSLFEQNNEQLEFKVNTLEQKLQSKTDEFTNYKQKAQVKEAKRKQEEKERQKRDEENTLRLMKKQKQQNKEHKEDLVRQDLMKLANETASIYLERRLLEPICTNFTLSTLGGMEMEYSYLTEQVQNMILEEDLDCFYETKFKGAVLYLGPRKDQTIGIRGVPTNRTDIFAVSLKRLHKYYNSLHHYPIFVFHEDYTKEDIKNFRTQFGHPLHFVKVDFKALPPCASDNQTLTRYLANLGNPLGYRQMCRFWSGIVQNAPILNSFEYYLRLDDDTMMMDYVNYDLFEYMDKYNKTYVFQSSFSDATHSSTLWQHTKEWLQLNKKTDAITGTWVQSHGYGGGAPYNNFHTSRFDFWKSKELWDLLEYLENIECGFIKYAWGDANFHAVALDSLLDTKLVAEARSVPVGHNWNNEFLSRGDKEAWAFEPVEQPPQPTNSTQVENHSQ